MVQNNMYDKFYKKLVNMNECNKRDTKLIF